MRAHYLQHVPFEGLGSIEAWLRGKDYNITCTRLYMDEPLPELKGIDCLIVLGGPMSVNDEADFPWLAAEKQFISAAIESDMPVLGICLGAQLIACSRGAEVYRNASKEIGWFKLESVSSGGAMVFKFPEEVLAFHWHGETFSLPEGAVQLASSRKCHNQAFQLGENVIALQFHLESTPESVRAIVDNCRNELVEGECIQKEEEILSAQHCVYNRINGLMDSVLNYLVVNPNRSGNDQDHK